MRQKLCILFLLFVMAVPARAAETDTGGNSETITLALSETEYALEPEETHTITATTTAPASNITWSIDNEKVLTQETLEGYSITVKGIGGGVTTVTARIGTDVSAVCTVTVSGISIAPAALEMREAETEHLTLNTFGKAKELTEWTWQSANADIASVTVTEDAVTVEGKSVGKTEITCNGGGYQASCAVTVDDKEPEPVEVTLSQTALVLEAGKTGTILATSEARASDIKWTVENPDVATVDPTAGNEVTVTAVSTGQTTLSARVGMGSVARCTVVVSGVAFASESLSVTAGQTLDVTPLTYGAARDVSLSLWEWSSAETSVATITATSAGGTIRGIQEGNSTIHVTVGDYTASCVVHVEPDESAATVSLSESTITMAPGTSSRLRATTLADSVDITWTIGNTDIAQIANKSGYTLVLTAGDPGQTVITAQVGSSPPASCTIIVSGVALSTNSLAMTVNASENLILTSYGEAQTIPPSSWEWNSSNTAVALVTSNTSGATVRAVGAGSTTITCSGGGYTVLCQVSVTANEASAITASLSGGILKFSDILSNLKSICQSMTEESLVYITNLAVDTKLGTLYDGYVSEGDTGFGVSSNRHYYAEGAAYLISNVTFVPKHDVNGTVRIGYEGYTVNNKTFSGSIVISVGQQEATLAYASLNGAVIHFRGEDFFNYSMSVNNRSLQYLTFTLPSSRYGTLYYNYVNESVYESVVSGGTRYYRTYNPSISNVAFVPNPAYSGNFSLLFTGYDTEGATFSGTVRISVNNPNGSDSGEELRERLHYETGPDARVYFVTDDFTKECKDRTGYSLVSIRFRSLPSTDYGRLYYGTDEYVYRNTEYTVPQISRLNFLAKKKYTGSFDFTFVGTTDRDTTFSGTIDIKVSNNGAYLILMSADSGTRAYLSASDFSEISRVAKNHDFHHVSFSALPDHGTLYYENTFTPVAKGEIYYRTGSDRLLSSVNYLSPDNYSGTVRIPYTLWDTDGNAIDGNLSITVKQTGSGNVSGVTTTYSTSGPAIALRAVDILTPAEKEIGDVTSVHFTPPSPSVGKLLLNYLSPGQYSPFDSTRDYTADTLGQIYFLPKAGFSGTASVTYVARNRYNTVYSGILRIQVQPPQASSYFSDLSNRAWAVPAVDFFRYYNVLNGTTPTTYEPDGPARRGAFITVLGRMYGFPNYPGNGGYEDVAENFYYTPYISAGRALGVTEAAQYFYPDAPISRQDAAVYLYRCLVRSGHAPNAPITNLARFNDGYLVSYYAMEAMSGLVELGVFQGDEHGYLNPFSTLTRLQMAAILYRAMT